LTKISSLHDMTIKNVVNSREIHKLVSNSESNGDDHFSSKINQTLKPQASFLNNLLYDKLKSLTPQPITLNKRQGNFLPELQEVIQAEKPSFSYKELIMIAICCDANKQMCLNDIYLTIKKWFPYYQQKAVGVTWQNSIRHNLSLNRCFKRLVHSSETGSQRSSSKGGSWTFDESDETWKKLMTTPMKWKILKSDSSELIELYEILAAGSEEFAMNIFPKVKPVCNTDTISESQEVKTEELNPYNSDILIKKVETVLNCDNTSKISVL